MSRYTKFITAVVGAITQAIALGLLDGDEEKWVLVLIAALTAGGVYVAPNTPPRSAPPRG